MSEAYDDCCALTVNGRPERMPTVRGIDPLQFAAHARLRSAGNTYGPAVSYATKMSGLVAFSTKCAACAT